MVFHRDSANILREFGVIFSPTANLSQFAGLEPFLAFLNKGRFRQRWAEQFGDSRARSMLQFILGIVVGARSMCDVAKSGADPLLKKSIGNSVGEAQLGRDVRSFDKQMIEDLHELVMSYSVLDFTARVDQRETLYFDVDATAIEKYGHQQGVEKGFIEKDKIENCYQYFFVRLHNRNSIFYGTIRAGSAHSQNDFCGYLSRFLPMLKKRWISVWRADSGYFNESAFDLFSENDVTFFIKAPMTQERLMLAETSEDLQWSQHINRISFSSRITQTENGTKYREIFKREACASAQLSLESMESYRYHCIASNDLVISEDKAFEVYNKRANIENNIRELKNDYQLGHIVTDEFDANDVITQLTLIAYMLIRHFQHEVLPPKMGRMQLSTLRVQLMNVPGRLLSAQRRIFIRIQNIFSDERIYEFIFNRLKRLTSWVLFPPVFEIQS